MLAPSALSAHGVSGWFTARTKHFVFVYQKRDRPAVEDLLSIAEGVYSKVTGLLGSHPKKIWVVVDGNVDTANGAFVPLPPHLVLYVTSPSVPVLGSKERDYLRMLLTHELTHYVHLDYNRGLFAFLSHLFGPGVKPGDLLFLPGWMMEGIAVNNETMFTSGGRGRDPYFQMISKALLLSDRFFSLSQAAYGSAFPPRERVYVGGYLMVHYLLEHFGLDTFRKIQRRFVKFPFFGPWAAIEEVTGESAARIFRDMKRQLAREYETYRSISPGRLLSPPGIGSFHLPVITARGWYLYRSNLDSSPGIVRYDPATGHAQPLVDTSLSDYSSLSSDAAGTKLVFATFEVTPGPAGDRYTSDLFAYDTASKTTRRLTRSAHLWQPALSPDGRTLVAVQRRGAYTRLVLVDQTTGGVTPLFAEPHTNVYNPTFSPNGRLLAFVLNDHGKQRIMLLSLPRAREGLARAGSKGRSLGAAFARPLPDSPAANAYFPRFAGNAHVVFSADLGKGLALYESPVASSGGGLYRVAEDPVGVAAGEIRGGSVIYTTYSPDGYVIKKRPLQRVAVSHTNGSSRATTSRETAGAPTNKGPSEGGGTASARSIGEKTTRAARRYIDWPRFLFWLPLPVYPSSSLSPGDLPLGFGLLAYGDSLLGRNSYSATLGLRTDVLQPSLSLSASSMLGPTTLSYGLSEGYTGSSSSGYRQTLKQSLSLSIPLVAEYLMGVTTNLSLAPNLGDQLAITHGAPFSFAAPINNPGGFSFSNSYSVGVTLSYGRTRWGAPLDIFPPDDLELDLAESYYPPPMSAHLPGLDSVFAGSFSFPSPFPHQVVRVGLKTSYSTIASSAPRTPLVNPRGLFLPYAGSTDPVAFQSTPGRSVAEVGYLATIGLYDRPLPFGFNFQGLGIGLHLAAAADWSAVAGSFTPDPYLYAGIELVSLVGYSGDGGAVPVDIGVTFRFSPTRAHPFDPLHDIGPYISIGTNSFQSAGLPLLDQLSRLDSRRR